MLNACATALTEKLLCRFPMVRVRRAVYIYGFEITISSLAVMLSVFILSCLCGAVYTSFTFSLIFVSIRLFSGGYHAKTYGRCFILSNAVYLICFDAARLIQTLRIEFLCPFLVLSSMAVVFMLTPIKNKNHPMSDVSYRKNRNIHLLSLEIYCSGARRYTKHYIQKRNMAGTEKAGKSRLQNANLIQPGHLSKILPKNSELIQAPSTVNFRPPRISHQKPKR